MAMSHLALISTAGRPVRQLVENRTLYESHNVDLAIYDTYEQAQRVRLDAEQVLYCGMLTGKKVLHGKGDYHSAFLPNESFVMSPGDVVEIDFPEATEQAPTTCLTLAFSPRQLTQMSERLEQQAPLLGQQDVWQHAPSDYLHTRHSQATQNLLMRIVEAFVHGDNDRDLVLNFGLNELLLRMMRHYGVNALQTMARQNREQTPLTAVLAHIEDNLHNPIAIDTLCKLACMSRSKLYQQFANLAGCSPMEFIQRRRLERARTLLQSGQSVTQACMNAGFVNLAHFTRRFHLHFGACPSQFLLRVN
ncbi:AraC family transcriptional regulator [Bowmanella sp. JS7-9]|uniref:AraC family transcriptional regulator n=1 Tax=Alteromonadaceae TaxID=72275 RepID=UPI00103CB514|nr:helix-turn-helix domain-containing protein [Bowmanella sp. JS7-9]TBX21955.1 hypothetical protein TK45_10755 [Bowmanella sp. JS7-9]